MSVKKLTLIIAAIISFNLNIEAQKKSRKTNTPVEIPAEKSAGSVSLEEYQSTIKDGVLSNKYFGFSLYLPQDWNIVDGHVVEYENINGRLRVKKNTLPKQIDEFRKNLIILSKYPLGKIPNANLVIMAGLISNINRPWREIVAESKQAIEKYKEMPYLLTQDLTEIQAGHEKGFFYEFSSKSNDFEFRQRQYIFRRKGHMMIFNLFYTKIEELKELEKTIQTLRFEKENN
ncbi:MAG: hypothetical protein M3209_08570 [Acidobacteriota bacterium]|nr:hypothetical protein [Acidobacteriota bacterium]